MAERDDRQMPSHPEGKQQQAQIHECHREQGRIKMVDCEEREHLHTIATPQDDLRKLVGYPSHR